MLQSVNLTLQGCVIFVSVAFVNGVKLCYISLCSICLIIQTCVAVSRSLPKAPD